MNYLNKSAAAWVNLLNADSAAVHRTADEVEHDVRASSIAMVGELHAKIVRWLHPGRRHAPTSQMRTSVLLAVLQFCWAEVLAALG